MPTPDYYLTPDGTHDLTPIVGQFDYWRGAAIKYVWRAGRKPGVDERSDILKAIDCLKHELAMLDQVVDIETEAP